jgi:hypothetical protein
VLVKDLAALYLASEASAGVQRGGSWGPASSMGQQGPARASKGQQGPASSKGQQGQQGPARASKGWLRRKRVQAPERRKENARVDGISAQREKDRGGELDDVIPI